MFTVAQEVVFTNTINVTTILAIVSIVGIIGGAVVVMFFKLVRQVQAEIFATRIEFIKHSRELTELQTAQLERCIHAIPGHPENPTLGVQTDASTLPASTGGM